MPADQVTAVSRVRMIVVLGVLSMFGPLSLDLYLPALPELATELGATTSAAQFTLTSCLLGLAVGQLVAGPLSDRYGRRRPLLLGLAGFMVASFLCALAPSIGVLVALRLVQGLCGGAGLVISRAVARDLYGGRELLVFLTRLMLINGLAPVLAPLIGGQLARVLSWRGMFVVLGVLGAALLVAGLLVPETLPAQRRVSGGLGATVRSFRQLFGDRLFVGSAAAAGLAFASMFAYIAGATFVLQEIHGLSPQQFSYVFGANSVCIVAMGQIAGRLARRWSPAPILALGLAQNLLGAVVVAVAVFADLGLGVLLAGLLLMVSALGMVFPTATALALLDHPDRAGAASALLGLGQFLAGAAVAPLVGVAGSSTAVPLAVVVASTSAAATLIFVLVVWPVTRVRRDRASPATPG